MLRKEQVVMIGIIIYLILLLCVTGVLMIGPHIFSLPSWYLDNLLFANCAYMGALGGILYCLRAVYLNKCVSKNWDKSWETWYYLRPITSTLTGLISSIFLKAGLLVLQASNQKGETPYGYFAIAFIAGFNVDNFLKKIESIMQSAWGIKKSRSFDKSEDERVD